MKIFVKVKPNAKEQTVKKIDEINFVVSVKEPPSEGKANRALIITLADYFGIAQQRIKIATGHKSKQKIVNIA